jgi:hypothetical protein
MSYRKIWESYYGPIPKDQLYDIHHIDGDRSNNNISNLKLVTPREHYDIHYAQKDWGACYSIAQQRLNLTPAELSTLASNQAKTRVANGTHHFLIGGPREDLMGDKNPMRRPEVASKQGNTMRGIPKSESHVLSLKTSAQKRAQRKITCEHCSKSMNDVNYNRWHGKNCKEKNNVLC